MDNAFLVCELVVKSHLRFEPLALLLQVKSVYQPRGIACVAKLDKSTQYVLAQREPDCYAVA